VVLQSNGNYRYYATWVTVVMNSRAAVVTVFTPGLGGGGGGNWRAIDGETMSLPPAKTLRLERES
jgi:hypothetical protein